MMRGGRHVFNIQPRRSRADVRPYFARAQKRTLFVRGARDEQAAADEDRGRAKDRIDIITRCRRHAESAIFRKIYFAAAPTCARIGARKARDGRKEGARTST